MCNEAMYVCKQGAAEGFLFEQCQLSIKYAVINQ